MTISIDEIVVDEKNRAELHIPIGVFFNAVWGDVLK